MVVGAVAQQERWPSEWAYDGGKSIFALKKFLPQHENTMEVIPSPVDLPAIKPKLCPWFAEDSSCAFLSQRGHKSDEDMSDMTVRALSCLNWSMPDG